MPIDKVMMIFPRSHVWDWILEHAKTLTSSDHISENIVNQDLRFLHSLLRFRIHVVESSTSKASYKTIYSENSKMTCLKQWNPRIKSYDTKRYETKS